MSELCKKRLCISLSASVASSATVALPTALYKYVYDML